MLSTGVASGGREVVRADCCPDQLEFACVCEPAAVAMIRNWCCVFAAKPDTVVLVVAPLLMVAAVVHVLPLFVLTSIR